MYSQNMVGAPDTTSTGSTEIRSNMMSEQGPIHFERKGPTETGLVESRLALGIELWVSIYPLV
jgi:hypothetical protein